MKLLYFSGPTWMFMTPEQMYGEEGKLRSAHRHYLNATLYFLTKMRKVRFKTSQTHVKADGRISVNISVGDPRKSQEQRFEFPLIELLFSMRHITERFKDREQFFQYALLRLYRPATVLSKAMYGLGTRLCAWKVFRPAGIRLLKWSYAREVSVIHRSDFEVVIVDPIARELTNPEKVAESRNRDPASHHRKQDLLNAEWDLTRLAKVNFQNLPGDSASGALRLTVDQVVNHFGIDVGPQEVLYIGKTKREPFDRLIPHSHLQELQAKFLRNDEEALVVHMFDFGAEDVTPNSRKASTVPFEKLNSAIEGELINYFKPVENTPYVGDSGKRDWDHIVFLRKQSYSEIRIQLEIDHQYTKFVGPGVRAANPNRHFFVVDLKSLQRRLVPAS